MTLFKMENRRNFGFSAENPTGTKGGGTLERIEPKEFKADISENIATAVIPINENELFDGCRIRVYVCLNDGSMREIGRIAVKKV